MIRVNFILWYRNKFLPAFNRIGSKILKMVFSPGLVLTLLGIYLAWKANQLTTQGNNLSEAAYNLSKNDTSQQAQLNRLIDIISKQDKQIRQVDEQIDIGNTQTKKLLQIVLNTKRQDSLTLKVLASSQEQLYTQNKTERNHTLLAYYEYLDLIDKIHDPLWSVIGPDSLTFEKLYNNEGKLKIFNQIKVVLDEGVKNVYLINNPKAFNSWWALREQTSITSFYFNSTWNPSLKLTSNDIIISDVYNISAYQEYCMLFYNNCMKIAPIFPKFELNNIDRNIYGLDSLSY